MTEPSTKSRILRRRLLKAAMVAFVVLTCAGAGFLYSVLIKPIADKAATFDLSRLASPELPPDALHQAIPIQEVPAHVIHALVSREDPRFYRHSGIDYVAIAREFWRHWKTNQAQGARTITQQLVLMSFDLSRHSNRHLLLLALARRIEREFTKEQILECYLNRVFLGTVAERPVYGIEAASHAYFEVKTSSLRLGDGAMLVGLIRSPVRLSPYRDEAAALEARNEVLHRMAAEGYITKKTLESALAEPLRVKPLSSQSTAP